MSEDVFTATEDTPLAEIVAILERRRIRRILTTRDGALVGVVSRANLIQAFASAELEPAGTLDPSRAIHQSCCRVWRHNPRRTSAAAMSLLVEAQFSSGDWSTLRRSARHSSPWPKVCRVSPASSTK
jgi:CBS domain-containing protein